MLVLPERVLPDITHRKSAVGTKRESTHRYMLPNGAQGRIWLIQSTWKGGLSSKKGSTMSSNRSEQESVSLRVSMKTSIHTSDLRRTHHQYAAGSHDRRPENSRFGLAMRRSKCSPFEAIHTYQLHVSTQGMFLSGTDAAPWRQTSLHPHG